jgi:hypothetical protein
MFLQLGQAYTPSIEIIDTSGFPVTMDTPVAVIKKIDTNEYWNGFMWQKQPFHIIMVHVADGVYTTTFIPDNVGLYQIFCKSETYNKSNSVILEVAEENAAKFLWTVNMPFNIICKGNPTDISKNLKIIRTSDNSFWNGSSWVQNESYIEMKLIIDTCIFSYTFTPDTIGSYSFLLDSQVMYMLEVVASSQDLQPVIVNNNSLLTAEGTDTTIITTDGIFLSGVQVSAISVDTKQLIAKTISNIEGGWNLVLTPGNYFFTFEKNGYISVGFQKAVM